MRDYLKGRKIGTVYSRDYVRTGATAAPTADAYGLPLRRYNATASAALVDSLKAHDRTNVLIIGHSNTVDDVMNRFVGNDALADLPDSEYGSLFIAWKKGRLYRFEKSRAWR